MKVKLERESSSGKEEARPQVQASKRARSPLSGKHPTSSAAAEESSRKRLRWTEHSAQASGEVTREVPGCCKNRAWCVGAFVALEKLPSFRNPSWKRTELLRRLCLDCHKKLKHSHPSNPQEQGCDPGDQGEPSGARWSDQETRSGWLLGGVDSAALVFYDSHQFSCSVYRRDIDHGRRAGQTRCRNCNFIYNQIVRLSRKEAERKVSRRELRTVRNLLLEKREIQGRIFSELTEEGEGLPDSLTSVPPDPSRLHAGLSETFTYEEFYY